MGRSRPAEMGGMRPLPSVAWGGGREIGGAFARNLFRPARLQPILASRPDAGILFWEAVEWLVGVRRPMRPTSADGANHR